MKKKSAGEIAFQFINGGILLLFTLLCVFPLYYIFINTISDNNLVTTGSVVFVPKGIHFDNYKQVLQIDGLGQAALISVLRTIIGTVFTLIGTSVLGYTLSKKEMWGQKFWYRFVIVSMYFNAGLIPWYITMKNYGLLNNFWAYILPTTVVPFYLLLFKTFIEQLPPALEEAAAIDGAGFFTRYVRVVLPLCKPILATIAIFSCVAQWNNFMDTVMLMTKSNLYTLQFVLNTYLKQVDSITRVLRETASAGNVNYSNILTATSVRMTITIIVTAPILFVYPFFQRFYVKGVMIGAVKG